MGNNCSVIAGADYKVFDQLTGDPMDISPWIQSANEKNRALTTLTGEPYPHL